MPYTGQSGQYGGIPYAELRKKYEVTSMGDNAHEALYNEMRSGLRDVKCSATFFESDHKRDNTQSESFLSLRHTGHRSGEEPWAPDLFLELTGRDPRGALLDPNMRKMSDQAWERRKQYRFYNDGDNSITEREKRPQVLIRQLRDAMELTKQRLKIFSTSKDSRSVNVGVQRQGDRQSAEAQTSVTDRDEILSALRSQQRDSDPFAIGWEQTGDHEFKIAQLGQTRGAQRRQDGTVTRSEQAASQRGQESAVQAVKTGAANLMRVLMDQGRTVDVLVSQDGDESRDQASTGVSRFRGENNARVAVTGVHTATEAQAFGAVQRFIGQLQHQSGMQGQDIETQLQIVQFMDNAVVASKSSSEARFRAEDIVLSARTAPEQTEQATKRAEGFADPLSRHNVGQSANYSDSTAVAQLGTGLLRCGSRRVYTGEGYKSSSRETTQKRARLPDSNDELSRAADYTGAQYHHTFSTADRTVRGLGTKFTRDRMDTERTLNAISSDS